MTCVAEPVVRSREPASGGADHIPSVRDAGGRQRRPLPPFSAPPSDKCLRRTCDQGGSVAFRDAQGVCAIVDLGCSRHLEVYRRSITILIDLVLGGSAQGTRRQLIEGSRPRASTGNQRRIVLDVIQPSVNRRPRVRTVHVSRLLGTRVAARTACWPCTHHH
jgi:hypothetical protein